MESAIVMTVEPSAEVVAGSFEGNERVGNQLLALRILGH